MLAHDGKCSSIRSAVRSVNVSDSVSEWIFLILGIWEQAIFIGNMFQLVVGGEQGSGHALLLLEYACFVKKSSVVDSVSFGWRHKPESVHLVPRRACVEYHTILGSDVL